MGYSTNTVGFTPNAVIVPITATVTTDEDLDAFRTNAAEGEVGVFLNQPGTPTRIGAGGIPAAAALAAGNEYVIAQKVGDNVIKSAPMTFKAGEAIACDVVAAVAQVSTATVTVAATSIGEEFELKIIDRTEGSQPHEKWSYRFVSVTGAESAAAIATAIVADYTSRQSRALYNPETGDEPIVTLVDAGAGAITITAIDPRTEFEVVVTGSDVDITGTVVLTTPRVHPSGDLDFVRQLEKEDDIFDGLQIEETYRRDNWGTDNRYTSGKTNCTYDMIKLFTIEDSAEAPRNPNVVRHQAKNLIFAIESTTPGTTGSASYTALKTIFGL